MRDLRKQALESHKTVSRKARSKATTPSSSRAASRTGTPRSSNSRNVSDDEGELSDTTQFSTNSIDELVAADVEDIPGDEAWREHLLDRINEICDRKRSSVQGREDALQAFNVALTRHFANEEVKMKGSELVPAVLKSVRGGQSEREVVLALKALVLMVITDPSEGLYDAISGTVKATMRDSEYAPAKIAAIHVLSVATFYGGAATEEVESVMEIFLDVVSSDGNSIDEPDNAELVVTALEEWGFLATQLEDMEDTTEPAMETFVDQLESSDVGVQIAAGENIALLYEKSFTEAESDDELDTSSNQNGDLLANGDGEKMVRRYTVYRQQHQLEHSLSALAKAHSKRLSKKDKKSLHQTFADILHTVEVPTRGPRYSTALDEDGREFGSRMKVQIRSGEGREGGKMLIDRWWKLHRLRALKRVLREGFLVHYEGNEVVFDSLPVIVED